MYGGRYTVSLIPGDGIGVELANAVKTVFKEANVPVEWEQFDITGYGDKGDEVLLGKAVESLKRNKVGLKGAICRILDVEMEF